MDLARFKKLFFLILVWIALLFALALVYMEERHQTSLSVANKELVSINKKHLEDMSERTQSNKQIFINTQADVGEIKFRIKRIEQKLGIED